MNIYEELISKNTITYEDYLTLLGKEEPLPRLSYYQNIGLHLVASKVNIPAEDFIRTISVSYGKERLDIDEKFKLVKLVKLEETKKIACGGCGGGVVR